MKETKTTSITVVVTERPDSEFIRAKVSVPEGAPITHLLVAGIDVILEAASTSELDTESLCEYIMNAVKREELGLNREPDFGQGDIS